MQIRMRGEGDQADPKLPPGDLLVVFRVEDAPAPWVRDGVDLHQPLALDLPTAVLGGQVQVEGLDGLMAFNHSCGHRRGSSFASSWRAYPIQPVIRAICSSMFSYRFLDNLTPRQGHCGNRLRDRQTKQPDRQDEEGEATQQIPTEIMES